MNSSIFALYAACKIVKRHFCIGSVAVDILRKHGHSIAVAESCTGGLVMSALVAVAGCSDVVLEGICTYSNTAKVARIGVQHKLISNFGAVSPQVAAAMARGVAITSGASVGVATTGIAGPGGGTIAKPVGLVYVAVYTGGRTYVKKLQLVGGRNSVRIAAARHALKYMCQIVEPTLPQMQNMYYNVAVRK